MATIQPDLHWYTEVSTSKNLAPRCPYASVHRCPRYFESTSLLGQVGVTTSIDPAEDQRLVEKWKRSDLWPVTQEQASQVMGSEGKPSLFLNFCPEVSFERFGWFSSDLSYHADEIDVDVAHRNLAREGATAHDWRWTWSLAKALHYSDCSLYSPLLIGANEVEKNKLPIGFGH